MRFPFASLALPALLLLTTVFAFGCSSADHPTAPSGSTLSITASSTKIGLEDSAEIRVTGFRPDGNRLAAGTLIRFSASLGTIEPAVTEVGADGFARAVFQADGRAGTATITASLSTGGSTGGGDGGGGNGDGGGSGAGTGAESASVSIEVSTEQPTLLLSANPSVLQVLESSQITITARDENSLPLGAGEEILLTADLGTLTHDGVEVDSVQTEADGRAMVLFQAGTQAGNGSVTAVLRNSEPAEVSLEIRDAPASFTFNVSPSSIPNGGGSVTLSATVVNGDGVALPGVLVRFGSQKGPSFDPSSSVTTNTRGEATATATYDGNDLTSGETIQVTATVRIGDSDSTQSATITVQ